MSLLDMLLLENLTWRWHWLIILTGLAVLYSFLLHRFGKNEVVRMQPISFSLGCLLLFLMLGSPFATLNHISFTLHMAQMSVLFFFVPPLLMLSIPVPWHDFIIKTRPAWWPSIPFTSLEFLYTFSILFLLYHIPSILSILVAYPVLQKSYLLLLFLLSFGMWRPLASPDPLLRLCACKMKKYAFWSGLAIMPACLLFVASAFFENAHNPFLLQLVAHLCGPGFLDSLQLPVQSKYDRLLAGALMLILHKSSLVFTLKWQRIVSADFYDELDKETSTKC
ncbi:cytochrome c oxidase assembly protein [Sporosarcina cyprini]|uniref:cytochrome c oxidase assembly protein n=1 Tax=Sporosarcina cyprini TaxID=2910523 RepID=UPI001EE14A63|nr:cytochrome c oxidase assembly protein [Sporosarcina cyprini]MCG3086595.1 cytochrome c oxidase assembly protein [Sporosarcina cyprini]